VLLVGKIIEIYDLINGGGILGERIFE